MSYQFSSLYRPDIDGLRAIAVLSVLMFHGFPDSLPGGFAGVDIFFVISGFLITNIIWREQLESKFSLSNFYARRVRRIFPALILVLTACVVFGWFILFEDEYKQLGNHTLRASVFLINFQLWKESGYFDAQAELKPLLHLWSLSIEEQFYIFWPLLLGLLIRYCRHPHFWLCTIFAVSYIWNIYQSLDDPAQNFYSPLTRFWELTAGGLLAISLPLLRERIGRKSQCIIGLVGIIVLIFCMLLMQLAPVYPGAWAVLPVIGTICYLASESKFEWLQRLVTKPVMLWIGKISYPLYLWHWPVLSFARIIEGQTPKVEWRIACLVFSLFMANLTARYVESYFRREPLRIVSVWFLVITIATLSSIGYVINRTNGIPNRDLLSSEYITHQGSIGYSDLKSDAKQESLRKTRADIALFGDSHADHLLYGLEKKMPNYKIVSYTYSAIPIISNSKVKNRLDELLREKTIHTVIIASHWHKSIDQIPMGSDLTKELGNTVKVLRENGKKVILVDDIYQFEFDPQRCKYARPLSGGNVCTAAKKLFEHQTNKYLHHLMAVQKKFDSVQLIRIGEVFCNGIECSMISGDEIAYRDNNHLNDWGSQIAANVITKKLIELNN